MSSGGGCGRLLLMMMAPTLVATVKPPVIVTAASLNHLCPLLEMLESVHRHAPANPVVVVGLDPAPPHIQENWLTRVHPRVEFRRFRYEEHPPHLNVTVHAGQYAWKPVIVREAVEEFGRVWWVDSGNRLTSPTATTAAGFDALVGDRGIWSPTSPGHPWQWVHMGTMAYFGLAKCCDVAASNTKPCCCCDAGGAVSRERGRPPRCHACPAVPGRPEPLATTPGEWAGKTMCNGALIAFSRDGAAYERVLVPWWECALDPACISPVYGQGRGSVSTRGNHRQDQAALTMLAHFSNASCAGSERDAGFTLHNDRVNDNALCRGLRESGAVANGLLPEHDRNPLR